MDAQPPPAPPRPPQGMPDLRAMIGSLGQAMVHASGGGKKSDWKPPSGWVWGLAPVLFAALKVLVVSHGDPEALRALVQDLNVTALVLATVLPFGAVIAALATLTIVMRARTSGGQSPSSGPVLVVALLITTIGLLVWATPVWQFGAVIGFVAVAVLLYFGFRRIGQWAQRTRPNGVPGMPVIVSVLVVILALLAGPFVYLIGGSGMWLPQERITVLGKTTSTVYVLSSDDRWTRYMDEGRKVHLVSTADITGRYAVGSSGSWLDKSIADNAVGAVKGLVGLAGRVCG